MNQQQQYGQVYLIGAGPGDPGMITLRAVECLKKADIVLYDYLVNPQILLHANEKAHLICLGRHGQGRILSQDEINQKMIEFAKKGLTVARLKGGDPAVFACGAQEAEILAEQKIEFEIVPGITVALAAGSCVGIPVTHSQLSSAVALVTGHESHSKQQSAIDYAALANFPGTLVFYMGITTAKDWTSQLIEAGKSPATPAAIVRHCSWPTQQHFCCTLESVAETIEKEKLRPPAMVIIGEVVTLSDSLNWFSRRPLFGQTILVTRATEQAAALRDPLAELGAQVLTQAAIEISDPDDWQPVDTAIENLSQYDWLVFSSANGVRFFLDRLMRAGDLRRLGNIKLATIGPATSEQLAKYHLKVDLHPEEYRAEALATELTEQAASKKFLLARANRGREVLAEELTNAGGQVDQIVVYKSHDVQQPDTTIAQALQAGNIDWITVTSSAIARSLVAMFGGSLKQTKLVSISPITTDTLEQLGHSVAAEAETYTMDGIVEAISKQFSS